MSKQVVVGVKVNHGELEEWKLAAGAEGKSVPMWLRGLGNGACVGVSDAMAVRLKEDKEVAARVLKGPSPEVQALLEKVGPAMVEDAAEALGVPPDFDDKVHVDPPRCPVCGWPLYENVKDGCVAGNCSQRPRF
jgi:hypothetical protein